MSDATILMLGGASSGKTCFMLGMYNDMRYGREGFTFSAIDSDMDRLLSDRWESIENNTGMDRFPAITEEYTEYDFSFNYALRRFMTFKWIDYPGRELTIRNSDLKEYLENAIGILICLPGDYILDYIAEGRRTLKSLNTDIVNQLLLDMESHYESGVRPSIIVLVTKFDLFIKKLFDGEFVNNEGVSNRLRRLKVQAHERDDPEKYASHAVEKIVIDILKVVFAKDCGWNVLICPVTLGMEISDDNDSGPADVLYMHLPVLFTFLEYARRLKNLWQDVRNGKEVEIEGVKKKWFPIFKRTAIVELSQNLEKAQARIAEIEARERIVQDGFPEDAIVYRNGERRSGP
jgi:GTPase SAR1 family protein